MLILATVVVSGVALVAWTVLTKPDLEHHLARSALPLWAYRSLLAFALSMLQWKKPYFAAS